MSKIDLNTVEINGTKYVRADQLTDNIMAENIDGLEYCIIRADRAGVFAGYVGEEDGQTVTILECRRLWYWDGAASCSQIAVDGVSKKNNCKFPAPVAKAKVHGVIEVIPCTEKAMDCIQSVEVWNE